MCVIPVWLGEGHFVSVYSPVKGRIKSGYTKIWFPPTDDKMTSPDLLMQDNDSSLWGTDLGGQRSELQNLPAMNIKLRFLILL